MFVGWMSGYTKCIDAVFLGGHFSVQDSGDGLIFSDICSQTFSKKVPMEFNFNAFSRLILIGIYAAFQLIDVVL